MRPYLLAFDLGTSTCRAELFDIQGISLGLESREWAPVAVPGIRGSQELNLESIWALLCGCARSLITHAGVVPRHIGAISCASFGGGFVAYDGGGRVLWACTAADSRAEAQARALSASGQAAEIYLQSGDGIAFSAVPRVQWLRQERPDLFRELAHISGLGDWILYRLTGAFVTDPSLGSTSGMFDLTSRSWSTDTVSLCHLPDSALPEVADTGTPIGVVMDGAAQDMGLARGTPVVLGGWDTALAQIGAGLPNSDQLTVIGGTFWKASALTNDPVIDPRGQLRSVCHAVPALWMLEAIGFYSGLTLRWFRDGFCQEEKRQAEASGMDTYALMEQQALDVPPGSGGVIGVFSNVMNVQAWRHAAPSFVQFDIGHPETSGKRECIRAIEESAAYVVRAHLTLLENALGRDLREIFLGGGAAKARLWPRVLADITGRCVRVATSGETTTRGAAIVAAIGVDLLDDLPATSRRLARVREVIEPDPSRLQTYEALYEQWISVNRGMLQLTDRAGLAPLWRAPGSPDAAPGIVTSTAASRDDEP